MHINPFSLINRIDPNICMIPILRKIFSGVVVTLLCITMLLTSKDSLHLNVAQAASAPHYFDLVEWHISNSLSKWTHLLRRTIPGQKLSENEKLQRLEEYFQLSREMAQLDSRISTYAGHFDQTTNFDLKELTTRSLEINSRRHSLRNDVEETIESTISSILAEEKFTYWGGALFPPVDIRLTDPPAVLVTSTRNSISRIHNVLLNSTISLREREQIEEYLLNNHDMSAIVLDIGGVATYPASLPNSRTLRATLQTSAHEWIHHYLFFKSLGQNYWKNSEMQILNETFANIAGIEIGNRAFQTLIASAKQEQIEISSPTNPGNLDRENPFDFMSEMRKTRLHTDEMLVRGEILQAEKYMEQRRKLFIDNGFFIRKLNQAYFAFHGTYGDSAASISPIGSQLQQFRILSHDLGTFIRLMANINSYDHFLEELHRLKSESEPQQNQLN